MIVVDEILFDLQAGVFILPAVNTDTVLVVSIETRLLVMIIESGGKVLRLADVDSGVGVSSI